MTTSSSESSISLRPPRPDDREPIRRLLEATDVFRPEEVAVALEVFDGCLEGEGYLGAVAEVAGQPVGFALWGLAPMTDGTYDLYWLAVDPRAQGGGAARALLHHAAADCRARGGRWLLVETESTPEYARARAFYEREGLRETARVRDYYRVGADKIIGAMPIQEDAS